jgi:hypothetical protein
MQAMSDDDNLQDWLDRVSSEEPGVIDFSFPSDKLRTEFLAAIEQRPDAEITDLLRKFLIPSSSFGADEATFHWLVRLLKERQLPRISEFHRRLPESSTRLV